MTRQRFAYATTVLLLLWAGSILALPIDVPAVRPGAQFELIPRELHGWRTVGSLRDDVLPTDPTVSERLARAYRRGEQTVWAAADYWAAQSEGNRLPIHDLLLPARGWTDIDTRSIDVPLAAGRRLPANLILMRTPVRHLAIIYWYQLGDRTVASDHVYRAVAMYRRLAERRADMALVRVAMPIGDHADPDAAVAVLSEFVRAFHPELVKSLPPHRSQEER